MARIAHYLTAAALLAAVPVGAQAAPFLDPVGDLLATYVGPPGADLDVVSTEVTLEGALLTFAAQLNGAIGTTPGGFYVFGVDRGLGTARFAGGMPSVGTGVLFDAVVVVNNNGTGIVRDLIANITTAIAPGAIAFSGASLTALVDLALLPSQGFAPSDYTFNLWPRSPGVGNSFIADFAPDNSNANVTVVSEPSSALALLLGSGLLGFAARRGARGARATAGRPS